MQFDHYEQYDALILDMDGTLIDSGQLHEKAWTRTLEHFGIPVERPLMRQLCGVPTKETVVHLLDHFGITISASPEDVHHHKENEVHKHLLDYIKPTALGDMVKHFRNQKPMAVGTGATTESAKTILEACSLLHLIDHVVGADLVSKHKPAPDTFLLCAEKLGVEASACVVFEDSPLGIEAAERAGMTAIDVQKTLNIENDYFL